MLDDEREHGMLQDVGEIAGVIDVSIVHVRASNDPGDATAFEPRHPPALAHIRLSATRIARDCLSLRAAAGMYGWRKAVGRPTAGRRLSPGRSSCGAISAGSRTRRDRPSKTAPCSIDSKWLWISPSTSEPAWSTT